MPLQHVRPLSEADPLSRSFGYTQDELKGSSGPLLDRIGTPRVEAGSEDRLKALHCPSG